MKEMTQQMREAQDIVEWLFEMLEDADKQQAAQLVLTAREKLFELTAIYVPCPTLQNTGHLPEQMQLQCAVHWTVWTPGLQTHYDPPTRAHCRTEQGHEFDWAASYEEAADHAAALNMGRMLRVSNYTMLELTEV